MRPISDRKPPNAAETPGARPKSAVLRNHEARSGPRSLAFRAATTQGRPSAAGIWEMSVKVVGRYRALLGTIPLKGGPTGSITSVLRLIDQIGEYMFRDVVLGPFKPEPVLSFVVDRWVTQAQVEALGTAINQGAFFLVPNRKGDSTSGEKDSKRFPESGGWGYALFNYDAKSDTFTADAATSDCGHACHTAVKSKDYIFHPYQKR